MIKILAFTFKGYIGNTTNKVGRPQLKRNPWLGCSKGLARRGSGSCIVHTSSSSSLTPHHSPRPPGRPADRRDKRAAAAPGLCTDGGHQGAARAARRQAAARAHAQRRHAPRVQERHHVTRRDGQRVHGRAAVLHHLRNLGRAGAARARGRGGGASLLPDACSAACADCAPMRSSRSAARSCCPSIISPASCLPASSGAATTPACPTRRPASATLCHPTPARCGRAGSRWLACARRLGQPCAVRLPAAL